MIFVVHLYAEEDLDTKKNLAEKKMDIDKNFFVLGILPNSSGTIDGYISGQLFYNTSLLSWIEIETTTKKESEQYFDIDKLEQESDYKLDESLSVKMDLIKFRFIQSKNSNSRFSISMTPYLALEYTYSENRYSLINADTNINTNGAIVQIYHDDRELAFIQAFGKFTFQYKSGKKFFVEVYGGAGLFMGFLYQNSTGLDSTNANTNANYSFTDDSEFFNPGWSIGCRLFYNFGPISLRLSGYFLRSSGSITMYNFDTADNVYYRDEYNLQVTFWNLRLEVTLNFLTLAGTHPSLFYGINSSQFLLDGENLIENYDDETGKTISLVHKFGLTMRF